METRWLQCFGVKLQSHFGVSTNLEKIQPTFQGTSPMCLRTYWLLLPLFQDQWVPAECFRMDQRIQCKSPWLTEMVSALMKRMPKDKIDTLNIWREYRIKQCWEHQEGVALNNNPQSVNSHYPTQVVSRPKQIAFCCLFHYPMSNSHCNWHSKQKLCSSTDYSSWTSMPVKLYLHS